MTRLSSPQCGTVRFLAVEGVVPGVAKQGREWYTGTPYGALWVRLNV